MWKKEKNRKMKYYSKSLELDFCSLPSYLIILKGYLLTILGESPVVITSTAAFNAPSTRFLTAVSV